MQDQILDLLLKKDEITWQNILYELVKTEQMDPWDIDLSSLSKKYLEALKKLTEVNFFISGKVILASAILLKMKSDKLLVQYMAQFDMLMFPADDLEEFEDFEDNKKGRIKLDEPPRLTVKTPLPRKKKVSLEDLVQALEKALEVDQRRTARRLEALRIPTNVALPTKTFDIGAKIKEIYERIIFYFKTNPMVTFTELVGSERREDKITTFVPLLHLANQEKVHLNQEEHFGEIEIRKLK